MKKTVWAILAFLLIAFSLQAAIIKSGNVLNIQVLGHAEFSGKYTVGESGNIDYPLLADVSVINITTSELMNDLTIRLARHIDNPLVLVTIEEHTEISVTVLGQVLKPGPVKGYVGISLQEAVVLAGGPIPTADLERIRIVHHDHTEASEVYNLQQFLRDGSIEGLPILRNGDMVVLLTQERTKKIKVIGAVQRPGLFNLEEKMNVFEVIYMAGGPAEKADLSKVRRFSQQNGKTTEEILDIQSYMDKGQMDNIPTVTEGDVLIVYTRWFDWKEVMSIMSNALLVIVTIQAFAGVFK